MSGLAILLVFLAQLGELQLHPGLLLDHPEWPWQPSLLAFAVVCALPWGVLAWHLQRLLPNSPGRAWAALAMGLAFQVPGTFSGVVLVQLLILILWARRLPGAILVLASLAYLPWHGQHSDGELFLLSLALAIPQSPFRPLLFSQALAHLVGAPSLPWEGVALVFLGGSRMSREFTAALLLLGLGMWERNLNRSQLIPLQESRLGLASLVWPASPENWARTRGRDFGVTQTDLETLLPAWRESQGKLLLHHSQPPGRLQPYRVHRILQRLAGVPDLAFPPEGESWVSHNADRGQVLPGLVGGSPLSPPSQQTPAPAWKELAPVGPGSWVEVTCAQESVLQEGALSLKLPAGVHRLQLPVATTTVRVQGRSETHLDLEQALAQLQIVDSQAPPDLTSNSLPAVQVGLALGGSQSLWVPALGVQLHRADLPEGWRNTSPITPVQTLLEPGKESRVTAYLEVPESGCAFACDFYWLAPGRQEWFLGTHTFVCRPRFPARIP